MKKLYLVNTYILHEESEPSEQRHVPVNFRRCFHSLGQEQVDKLGRLHLLHVTRNVKKITVSSSRIALMMEAVSISEMPINFYETARRNIPEDKSSSYSPPRETEISSLNAHFIGYRR
jgi:hypothetical protein